MLTYKNNIYLLGAKLMEKYIIKIGQEHMQLERVKQLLMQTYWAQNQSYTTIEKAMANTLCFGVFYSELDKQIAFARIMTDYATRFYILDVVVDCDYRNIGIGNLLIEAIINYAPLNGLRGLLMTKDAQDFYKKFGFEAYEISIMQKK